MSVSYESEHQEQIQEEEHLFDSAFLAPSRGCFSIPIIGSEIWRHCQDQDKHRLTSNLGAQFPHEDLCVISTSYQQPKHTIDQETSGLPHSLIKMADTKPRIDLIPWDFDSEQHQQRMYLQRLACGWRSDEIQKWVELGRAGKKTLYWIVGYDFHLRKGARPLLCC